ncbi:MAG TPA: tetratricopeptide repeat protein, partial [Aquaticitalea sp.]|nr:tetratricopeptide repeat protein [Aquaticitalea sp.]
MKSFFYILICLLSFTSLAQNETLFEQGNALYNNGEYEQAIQKYEAIIGNGKHSAELYYNLGNAHYKLNHIAPSIYYYEKALQLEPNDKEIKNNIAFAHNMTIDAVDAIPEVGLSKFINNLSKSMTFENWGLASIVFVVFFVILFLMYYFANTSTRKRLTFIGSMVSIVLACFALSFAFHNY